MNKEVLAELAKLESKSDLLEAEIANLDGILKKAGFPNGITTLKDTVSELLLEAQSEDLGSTD